mgnify:CR=1 FL=1
MRVPLFPVRMPERTGEEMQKKEEEPLPTSSSPSLRVLLIDDDSIQLTLTAAMLQHSGITSVSCMQPDELLDALRSGTFDVLLTDVQMPAISGFRPAETVACIESPPSANHSCNSGHRP